MEKPLQIWNFRNPWEFLTTKKFQIYKMPKAYVISSPEIRKVQDKIYGLDR